MTSKLSYFVDPGRETLRARGPDAVSWLNGLVTAELRSVQPGRGAYALLLTKTGKIQTDLDVLAAPGELVIGVAGGTAEAVSRVLDAHLVMEDVELERAPQLSWVRLLGDSAGSVAEELSGEALARGAIDWLGAGGAALVVEASAVDALVARLGRVAPAASALDADGWKSLRVRHGFPEFGADYSSEDNPHEAGLDRRAVSWDKGCYLGQEVVCMQDLRGKLKRRLTVLELATTELLAPDAPVFAEGFADPVGTTRSAARVGDRVLVFARLKAPHFDATATSGTSAQASPAFSVQGRAARIVALPRP